MFFFYCHSNHDLKMIMTPQTTKTTNNSVIPAPIQSVSLETTRLSGFEEVICSSQDVYPAPRVNLFTEPASLPDSLQLFTRKTADKQGLYSVESKLKKLKDLTYICLVQSFYRSQTWRASLQETGLISSSQFMSGRVTLHFIIIIIIIT